MVSPIGARGTADANKLACAVVCAGAVYCALNRRRLLRQINRYAPTQPDALHVHPNAPHRHTHTYAQIFSHTPAHTSGAEQMESGGGPYTSCLKTTTPSQSPQTHRALRQSTILICRNCLAPYSRVRPPMDCQGAVPSKMPHVRQREPRRVACSVQ